MEWKDYDGKKLPMKEDDWRFFLCGCIYPPFFSEVEEVS
jgi:hypothetical protein